jgi:Protein of unknown function (DUF3179)
MQVEGRSGARLALWIAVLCAAVSIGCLAIPMYVIRPFRPQDQGQLALALTVRGLGPWISAVCVAGVLWAMVAGWKRSKRVFGRIGLIGLGVLTVAAACLTHVNIFEIMFHPYPTPTFVDGPQAQVDADDKVLSVHIGEETHAYPIRIMGYHHIVNDSVGGVPIAATYCTLCHTGLVWKRTLDGKTLHFRLAGINNGNALMRDEETSSIWQQSTGQAIFGAFKGRQLELIHSDELTFSLWRAEQPKGLVLKPDAPYESEYETKDWEQHIEKTHTVIDTRKSGIAPHELMLGMMVSGESKAYPVKSILAAKIIQDEIAGTPVLIVVGPDQASIRVFQVDSTGEAMTFVPLESGSQTGVSGLMKDAATDSVWDFHGCAIQGKLAGHCLKPLDANKDYWFDWMNHHPATSVFKG